MKFEDKKKRKTRWMGNITDAFIEDGRFDTYILVGWPESKRYDPTDKRYEIKGITSQRDLVEAWYKHEKKTYRGKLGVFSFLEGDLYPPSDGHGEYP